jgi:EAL and modified HD-GYP domain-containing signal transduction protein
MKTDQADMSFPLITLQPVANARHGWVALSLDSSGGLDASTLGRIFCEFGLYDSLDGLPCVVALDDAPADLGEYIPAQDIILRLPAARCVDPDLARTLLRLQRDGFRLIADGLPPAGTRLPPAITGLSLTCGDGSPPAGSGDWLPRLAGLHLALGVDSDADLARCRNADFQWFGGNYPLHPAAHAGHAPGSPSTALLLKLLALVTRDAETREIEAILKQDPNLSFQLLRLVNSVSFALTQKITTFGQALQLLGRRQLQRWLQLLLYASPVAGSPSPLLPRAALRAALMEALLRHAGEHGEMLDRAFMAGMFSLLDILLDMPLDEVLGQLNLADDLTAALLRHEGQLGRLLGVVTVAERSPAALGPALAGTGIDVEQWAETLAQSCRWAIQVSRETA